MTTLVIAALIAPVAGYAADTKSVTESIKENVGDAVITTKIKIEYAKDKDVSAMKIKVDTDDKGMVTLSGNAASRAEADKAATANTPCAIPATPGAALRVRPAPVLPPCRQCAPARPAAPTSSSSGCSSSAYPADAPLRLPQLRAPA
jgi:hypothetical protein